jgi:hypothetical protein
MKRTIYLFGLICLVFFGCGKNSSTTANQESCSSSCKVKNDGQQSGYDANMNQVCQQACGVNNYTEDEIVDPVSAKSGDITKCPVSSAIYLVKDDSPALTHNGKSFHSCCKTCASIFETDPDRFINNL